MNNLPNIITSIRLVSAVIIALLCFCGKGTALFLPLFIAAGISDMLDGFVARRFGWCTEFGATLDSVSDLILYMSVALFLCVHAAHDVAQCTNLILIGAAAQLFHWFYCSRKLN